ncbi:MAG TPA: GH25 family lysozyme [Polyangiaceae bacterium]|jgi:GH25 family lysozyme M1 (1,4-beta-N-acetylmuramidase)
MRKLAVVFVSCLIACSAAPTPEDIGASSAAVTTVCGAAPSGPVQGRDVSVYQGDFDWNAEKAAGVVFGYARIGDGLGGDSQFAPNWSKMKAAGVLRGAYQFFEPGDDEVAQANLMIGAVGQLGDGDLPCMIDVEVTGGQSGGTIASKVAHWIQLVQAGTGKAPIIYTGPYFWQDNVGSTAFGGTPLWVADYGPSCPLIPPGWSNWTFWQYSDGNGSLDHDVFNGALSDLQALAAAPAPAYPIIVHRGASDINGDGQSDICARGVAGVVCEVGANEIQGPSWSDASGWNKPEYYWTIQVADVDGDGKGDLCARDSQGIVCEISTGDGFGGGEVRGPNWSDASGWAKPQYYSTIQFGDVNGDGKADVCARAAAGITCAMSNGKGFDAPISGPAWSDQGSWDQPQYYQTIQLVDVNGDGMSDLCGRAAGGIVCEISNGSGFGREISGPAWSDAAGWAKPQYMETIRFADVDGDGKADVCGRAAAGMLCELSDGNGFPTEVTGPQWSDDQGWAAQQYWSTIQTADVNGDGKADLCGRGAAGIVCGISDGKSFSTQITGLSDWSSQGGWDDPQYDSTIGFADIDGDGKDDVCARGWAGLQCALSTGTGFGALTPGAAWSNPNGWDSEPYYATIRYAGVRTRTPPAPHVGSDGGTSPPGSGNDGTSDGSGCSIGSRGSRGPRSVGWLALALGVFAIRRRRCARPA